MNSRNMKNLLRALSLTVLATLTLIVSTAAASAPREVVETIVSKSKELDNKQKYAALTREIESLVDFDRLANESLGSRFQEISSQDRAQIRDLLKKIVTRTVYPAAPKFFKDVQIQFTEESPATADSAKALAKVTSTVTKGDKRSTVEYWLAPTGSSYRVVDLAIEGERWVENLRDQFDEVLRQKGPKALIAKMQKRLSQIPN